MNELVTQALSICSLITAVAAVIALIVQAARKVKHPNEVQDRRIAECEARLAECEKKLAKDLDRFADIEKGTAVIMNAMLALLSHNIDGNDIQSMKEAKKDLQNYLIHSKVKGGGI